MVRREILRRPAGSRVVKQPLGLSMTSRRRAGTARGARATAMTTLTVGAAMATGRTKLPRSIGPLGPADFDDSAPRGKRRTEQAQLARILRGNQERKPHDSTLYRSDRQAALRQMVIQVDRELKLMAASARRVKALIEAAAPWTEDYHA